MLEIFTSMLEISFLSPSQKHKAAALARLPLFLNEKKQYYFSFASASLMRRMASIRSSSLVA